MNEILIGAIAMGSLVAALFFLRYWKSTNDRFFLFFAISFVIEGLNRLVLGADMQGDGLRQIAYYALRVIAYGLILFAVWDKNRPGDKRK